MTRRGGRHRPVETDGGEETAEAGEGEGAAEAGAGDEAGDAPGVPGVPGVPGDELRGGSGETVIGRRLSAAGS
ncbi:hypothetical protein AB0M05_15730 [Streptomyces violaceusniger]|uniref:hypothetical protein n=1 Tax=Streptomyces violaceusniger TaxID=68280 RepID=UPI00341CAC6E